MKTMFKNSKTLILYLLLLLVYACHERTDKMDRQHEISTAIPLQQDSISVDDTVIPDDSTSDSTAKSRETQNSPLNTEETETQQKEIPRMLGVTEYREITKNIIELEHNPALQNQVGLSIVKKEANNSAVPERMIVRIANYTKETVMTGLHFRVEQFRNGHWAPIGAHVGFEDLGYTIPPYKARDFPVLLFPEKHTYLSGKYRVIKSYSIMDYSEPYHSTDLFAEFEIK